MSRRVARLPRSSSEAHCAFLVSGASMSIILMVSPAILMVSPSMTQVRLPNVHFEYVDVNEAMDIRLDGSGTDPLPT